MKSLLFFFLLTAASCTSFSQPVLKEVKPESVGASTSKLKRIDSLLQDQADKKWMAGATAIVAKDGRIIYYKSIGYDNIDKKTPVRKDAIYRIASQTKAVTTVAIMKLYEEGKLKPTDPVSKYIPEFKNQEVLLKFNPTDTTYTTVPAQREITIHDLLTHTSGIGYAQIGSKEATAIYAKNGLVGGIGVDKILLGDKMKVLGKMPLFHQPGERWTYGLNTDLLGYLVEVISGVTLDEYFKKNIFEPLGMNDTYFYLPKEKYNRLSSFYTEDENHQVKLLSTSMDLSGEVHVNYPATEGTYFSGGGGLSSTALDYAIFMQMLLNQGEYNGKRILTPESVRIMTSKQYDKLGWPDTEMGYGFSLYTEKSSARTPLSPGSYEWGGMFSSTYWIDPKEKIVAQLFLNQYPNSHGEVHDKFKVLVYEALIR